MGVFDFLLTHLCSTVVGAIKVDYGKELMKDIICWADTIYSEHCKNGEKAFACLELRGKALFKRFYIIQGEEILCLENIIITENVSEIGDDFITSEEQDELRRNHFLIIKKY